MENIVTVTTAATDRMASVQVREDFVREAFIVDSVLPGRALTGAE
jgi:hypothetical protein